jgi:hypothetical protein
MGILNHLMSKIGKTSTTKQAAAESSGGAAARLDAETPAPGYLSVKKDMQSYLASDENEWIEYLRQAIRVYRKPGVSLQDEYHQWLAARVRARAIGAQDRAA